MEFDTTIDFIGKKSIEIETFGRKQYRITNILTITGNGNKLSSFVILKGKPDKIIKNHVKNLEYIVIKKFLYVVRKTDGVLKIYSLIGYKISLYIIKIHLMENFC